MAGFNETQTQTLARWRRDLTEAKLMVRAGLPDEATAYIEHVMLQLMLAQIFGLPAHESPNED